MTGDHQHFEVLSTLVASGQLTEMELQELIEHSRHCACCSRRLGEMSHLNVRLFCALAQNQPRIPVTKAMQERFIVRANQEGIPLSLHALNVGYRLPSFVGAIALVLLLVSASAHLGSFMRLAARDVGRESIAASSGSFPQVQIAQESQPRNMLPNSAPTNRTLGQQLVRHTGIRISHPRRAMRLPLADPVAPQRRQFAMTSHNRDFTLSPVFLLPANTVAHLIPGFSIQEQFVKLGSLQHSTVAKDGSTLLLAWCEQRTFAPWIPQYNSAFESSDTKDFRHADDLDARSRFFKPDFKENLPAFEFTR